MSERLPPRRRPVAVPGGASGRPLHFDGAGVLQVLPRRHRPGGGQIESAGFTRAPVPMKYEGWQAVDRLRERDRTGTHGAGRCRGATEHHAFGQGQPALPFARISDAVVVVVVEYVDDATGDVEGEHDVMLLGYGLPLG